MIKHLEGEALSEWSRRVFGEQCRGIKKKEARRSRNEESRKQKKDRRKKKQEKRRRTVRYCLSADSRTNGLNIVRFVN